MWLDIQTEHSLIFKNINIHFVKWTFCTPLVKYLSHIVFVFFAHINPFKPEDYFKAAK